MTAAETLPDPLRKRFATAQARFALRGGTVVACQADDGTLELVASWRHLTKTFPSVDSLEVWLEAFDPQAVGTQSEGAA